MFKFMISVVLAAAAIAGAFTMLTTASGRLDAGPLTPPAEAVLKTCTQQPRLYLNCVSTPLANPSVRLIMTDRLGA